MPGQARWKPARHSAVEGGKRNGRVLEMPIGSLLKPAQTSSGPVMVAARVVRRNLAASSSPPSREIGPGQACPSRLVPPSTDPGNPESSEASPQVSTGVRLLQAHSELQFGGSQGFDPGPASAAGA